MYMWIIYLAVITRKDDLDFSDYVILYPDSALEETLQFIFPSFDERLTLWTYLFREI